MTHPSLHGIYLILDEQWSHQIALLDVVRLAAKAGVRLFQYRNKGDSMLECYQKGLPLREAVFQAKGTFIVNDRCDLALVLEADGVHLGQEDVPLDLARSIMGKKIIGMSTHRPEEVKAATEGGADYIGFGPIFPTQTKRDHEPVVGIEGLKRVRPLTRVPLFAIGGLRLNDLHSIREAGADGAAVASVVFTSSNMEQTLHELVRAFS